MSGNLGDTAASSSSSLSSPLIDRASNVALMNAAAAAAMGMAPSPQSLQMVPNSSSQTSLLNMNLNGWFLSLIISTIFNIRLIYLFLLKSFLKLDNRPTISISYCREAFRSISMWIWCRVRPEPLVLVASILTTVIYLNRFSTSLLKLLF